MNEYRIEASAGSFVVFAGDSDMAALEASAYGKSILLERQRAKMFLAGSSEVILGEFDLDGHVIPESWADIQNIVSRATADAKKDAKENFDLKFIQSRGAYVCIDTLSGSHSELSSEEFEMPKSKKKFEALVSKLIDDYPDITKIYVMVSVDSAESMYEMYQNDNYQPQTGSATGLLRVFS